MPQEELIFWLGILQEHLQTAKNRLAEGEKAWRQEAEQIQQRLQAVQDQLRGGYFVSKADILALARETCRWLRRLLYRMLRCQVQASLYPLLVDHWARETRFFCQLLRLSATGNPHARLGQLRESLFWLRIFAEHLQLLSQQLDPTEQLLQAEAALLLRRLERCRLTLSNWESLVGQDRDFPLTLGQALADSRETVLAVLKYKQKVARRARRCQLLAVFPADWPEHLLREGRYFLSLWP
ncbi:MAG: DUF2935 domain-containing protein [Bacillota bacterium]|uniref:DUF2935 domain-containing protein n=1 Tax=unclassified Carboxydocella TaxID=2685367 RepID=UPI0009ABC2CB|nr:MULTISPECIES: DUF2935 domain-containing protein [unclassified Carboxydocella]AVX31647.1 protein of unknown function (DUF2935) [Carboxydocella thermautotrophica]GAW29260.1 protein of unknown function [Carboxydocella sp. ULO1]GAW30937.1 protein of unknown function [Carboxydocella sp. JDF658]